jgi:hypothetical protein
MYYYFLTVSILPGVATQYVMTCHLQVTYELLQGFVLCMLIIHGIKYINFQPRLALISKTLVGGLK